MTSISTTPVTPHQQANRVRPDLTTETAPAAQPVVQARAATSPSVISSASSPAQDGFLSKVFDILHKMGGETVAPVAPSLDAEDLQAVVSRIDTDGDGKVTSAEFVAARPDHITEEEAASLFSSIDTEGRGVLDVASLKSALSAQGPDEDVDTAAALDIEGYTGVDRQQFLASMPKTESPDDAVKSLLRLLGGKDEGGTQA